jgi:hypothetical protein
MQAISAAFLRLVMLLKIIATGTIRYWLTFDDFPYFLAFFLLTDPRTDQSKIRTVNGTGTAMVYTGTGTGIDAIRYWLPVFITNHYQSQ